MMEAIPRDYGRGQFDAFCKKVLKNEARAYLRNMKRQRDRETNNTTWGLATPDW